MLSVFPRDVLDEILNLIESVFEGFSSYYTSIEATIQDLTFSAQPVQETERVEKISNTKQTQEKGIGNYNGNNSSYLCLSFNLIFRA